MTKQDFIDKLSNNTGSLPIQDKIDACQYYLNEFVGLHVKITGGSIHLIEYAFTELQRRIKEFL